MELHISNYILHTGQVVVYGNGLSELRDWSLGQIMYNVVSLGKESASSACIHLCV